MGLFKLVNGLTRNLPQGLSVGGGRRALWVPPAAPSITGIVSIFVPHPLYCCSDALHTVPCVDGDPIYTWLDLITGVWESQSNASLQWVLKSDGGGHWYALNSDGGRNIVRSGVSLTANADLLWGGVISMDSIAGSLACAPLDTYAANHGAVRGTPGGLVNFDNNFDNIEITFGLSAATKSRSIVHANGIGPVSPFTSILTTYLNGVQVATDASKLGIVNPTVSSPDYGITETAIGGFKGRAWADILVSNDFKPSDLTAMDAWLQNF